jgi:hypothetical protein
LRIARPFLEVKRGNSRKESSTTAACGDDGFMRLYPKCGTLPSFNICVSKSPNGSSLFFSLDKSGISDEGFRLRFTTVVELGLLDC